MPLMTRIPSDLARFGLRVELVPGWESRGSAAFAPACVVDHWTAGPRGATGRPSLNVVVNGRAGLAGPLCNVYLARDGVCVVVAAGRANHAGAGGFRGLVGNSAAYGIEAECGGDGDWTPAMLDAYPRLNAALLSGLGRDASWVAGHNDWAPDRKIDIRDIIVSVRARTATALVNPSAASEESTVAQYDEIMRYLTSIDRKLSNSASGDRIGDVYYKVDEAVQMLRGNNESGKNNFHWIGGVVTSAVSSAAEQIIAAINGGVKVDPAEVQAAIEAMTAQSIAKAVADETDRRARDGDPETGPRS